MWDLDYPRLSTLTLRIAGGHERTFSYGVRKFEVRGTQLLLNGHPIRLGGANRAGDHPRFGLVEPQEVIEQDGSLLEGGEASRGIVSPRLKKKRTRDASKRFK